jgi:hypothetical protein
MSDPPLLPYAGTSGWSGSDTSRARALDADASGVTGQRQRDVLAYLAGCGPYGATWPEVAAVLGTHHGTASGALSVLHKESRIARLAERRGRCKIYVRPEYVNGRETEPHGRRKAEP